MTTNETSDPGVPPGAGQNPPRRPAGAQFFDSVRRMGVARSDDRWIGGVAAGVGERYGLDPLLVRGLLVLSAFLGGLGLVLYAVAWLLLPERSDGRIHLEETFRGTFDVAVVGAGIMLVVGLTWSGSWPWWGGPAEWVVGLLWIAFWVAVVWLVVRLVRSRRRDAGPRPQDWSPTGPPPAAWTPGATPSAAPGTADLQDPPVASADAPSGRTTHAAEAFTPAPRAHYVAEPSAPAAPAPGWAGDQQARPRHHRDRGTQPWDAGTVPPAPPAAPLPPVGPPPPPRPRTPRAGAASVGVVVGLSLLLGAGMLAATVVLGVTAPAWALWLGGTLVLLGGGLVVAGLRGRRGGGLTALAVLGLIAAAVTWPFTATHDRWDWDDWSWVDGPQVATSSGTVLGQGELTPRTVEDAAGGYRIQFGDATLDLTELDLAGVEPGSPVVVPVEMTGGRAVVQIPDGVAVEAVVDLNAGHFAWDVDNQYLSVNGFTGGPATYRTVEASDGGVVLLLDVDARAGELVIEEIQ
ncbi:phage shock protein C (PspC) family protein [Isoptericola jiangsuensis]|uniref:Phage shock protein C (PspC) family protein n=1 Tax=Isoptericola jiangsuensis TaxID=548579 RepID=A0A2A9EU76_9MICO|nr:PspC domain-containing protein [Isoptericola jiangsuensis]PFG42293.1 phage shock protein C (PspC) family protein [Isoptericola jiangsuensis]